jgi:D-glycero-D-manno-heptose 1,7-bisphosphate phosphatase
MKRKAIFLDRDGVINEDNAYIGHVDRFIFKAGIFDFLKTVSDHGYVLIVITNQSGVARGLYTESDFEAVTSYMLKGFEQQGIRIDLHLACFEHPQGAVPAYTRESFWRKPRSGMILEAAIKMDIDLSCSVLLGDQERDIESGRAAGVGLCLLLGEDKNVKTQGYVVTNFDEALSRILSLC